MKLTREEALKLHRQMWGDMRTALAGGNDNNRIRSDFKERWVKSHFPRMEVRHDCFLCEYAMQTYYDGNTEQKFFGGECCEYCPIDWRDEVYGSNGYACERGEIIWDESPISEILSLLEREINE